MTPDFTDLADLALFGPTQADPALCREADAVVVALARMARPVPPPPDMRARLMSLTAIEPRPYVKTAADGPWEDWLVPGLSRRVLYVDKANQRVTMLLRLVAGGRLPEHPHPGVEEVYLLEGDLHGADGNVLWAGDYQRSEAGTVHIEQWSVGGCTALLIAPMFDEAA
ncbi:MAG TPA: cupin domain-containing protein [Gemmataceae bacterium]|nr:cupin domain-containing protein [Gemmataceae bacterium]